MRPVLWLLVPCAVIALAVRPSTACSPHTNPAHMSDPAQGADRTPPGEATVTATFHESDDATKDFCSWAGALLMSVSAVDDATPADRLAFELRETRGRFPGVLPSQPIMIGLAGDLVLYSQSTDIDVTFEVRAVDLNGNYGPPVEVTVVNDGGCSTGGAGSLGAGLALIGLRRRRRSRDHVREKLRQCSNSGSAGLLVVFAPDVVSRSARARCHSWLDETGPTISAATQAHAR